MPIYLTEINIYPLKSAGRVALSDSTVEHRGLQGDRRWMLVDDAGVFISQREVPKLALIQVATTADGLEVTAPGSEAIHVRRPSHAPADVRIWKDDVRASDAGHDAARWFTRYVGRPTRLVYMPDRAVRPVDRRYMASEGDQVSFADGYPVLLTATASLAALTERTPSAIPMDRFRPNLVVTGSEPFEEDRWREIQIGAVRFHVVKGCGRCVVTTIDQETAEQGKEPLRTLSRFRTRDGNVYFGQYLIPHAPAALRLGDELKIRS